MAEPPTEHEENTDQPDKPTRRRCRPVSLPETSRPVGEEWMLTYMDTVTLLVTLFVLLLSFSTVSEEKFKSVAEGLSLDKYGAILHTGTPIVVSPSTPVPIVPPQTSALDVPEPDFASGLNEKLRQQGLTDLVEMKVHENVVDLQLNESVLFATGEAELTEQGLSVIARLVPLIEASGMNVSVEGHSDNIPISTARFPSNWELSATRAASVGRELIEGGIRPKRLHIRGYADTKPVASNDTTEGRGKNRRVNLVLSSQDGDVPK